MSSVLQSIPPTSTHLLIYRYFHIYVHEHRIHQDVDYTYMIDIVFLSTLFSRITNAPDRYFNLPR